MVDGDYMSLVKTRPVGQWRETLAVLATYTGADQWASLCDALASRLAQTGMAHAASLCYICAGNVDQVGPADGGDCWVHRGGRQCLGTLRARAPTSCWFVQLIHPAWPDVRL